MDITLIDIAKEDIKDIDKIINNFVSKFANEVVSINALAVCLQALIDKRDEIQKIVEEGENE